MFHPGPLTSAYELTAEDVIYSLQKAADPARSRFAGEYSQMTFEKVDDYTIRIIVQNPLSSIFFLPKISDYSGGFIISKKAMEAMGDEGFKVHPIGTGPFRFESHTPGRNVILRANKNYFRGQPHLDGVEIQFAPDLEKRLGRLYAGELDVVTGPRKKTLNKGSDRNRDFVEDLHGVGEVGTIHFNTRMKPLDDVRVRRAIAYALNREAFLDTPYKHAFENCGTGKIIITIEQIGDNTISIQVKDDGCGIPEDLNIGSVGTLGFKLIRNLIEKQLNGKLQIERIHGTVVQIEFQKKGVEKRAPDH